MTKEFYAGRLEMLADQEEIREPYEPCKHCGKRDQTDNGYCEECYERISYPLGSMLEAYDIQGNR